MEEMIKRINDIESLVATIDGELIAVEVFNGATKHEAVADVIEATPGFPSTELAWVKSDEAASVAYYKMRG